MRWRKPRATRATRWSVADIADAAAMARIFAEHRPDAVMHLAAESHVDRSIDGPAAFIQHQHRGHLHAAGSRARLFRDAGRRWPRPLPLPPRVSTDEVFGALADGDPPFTEATPYDPRSPYSASKAASDHLARAWQHTYGLPTLVSNTTNNYGPWQFPEKLIPLVMLNALEGKPLPVYGDGRQPAGLAVRGRPRRRAAALSSSTAARRARPTPSAPASRAAISTWCRRSAPSWTGWCPTPPAPAPADPFRARPPRP